MKKLLISLLAIGLTSLSTMAMTFDEAKTDSKPVVVMFHMKHCSACKKFKSIFDGMAPKFSNKFNFVKEDAESSNLAKSLNFMTVPAIFIVQPKTMAAKRINDDCAWDKECFAKTLQDY